MPATTRMSVEEYLSTPFEPDCDYVDGEVEERNVGERKHSRLQGRLVHFLISREDKWGVLVYPEQRVQVSPTRFRVPDVCVIARSAPEEDIFTHPPLLCIEILSGEDRATRVHERIRDYLRMRVLDVWVIDPETRSAFHHSAGAIREVTDGVLRASRGIEVPIAELFD